MYDILLLLIVSRELSTYLSALLCAGYTKSNSV
jgi:hypothetical protein